MANNKKVDALGFDRFQIASVRRAFQSNALTYKKMDGIAAKIKELGAQYDALEAQTQAWEAPAKQISKEVLGIELNSRQILAAHENPEAFFAEHPEGAINAEVVVGRCKKCGKYESFPNLSMYLPINVEENEKGRWSVPVPSEGAAYVAPWDLEESYKLYATYQHKCKSCGGDMDILTEKDLVESGIICPECGKTIECGANIMWD